MISMIKGLWLRLAGGGAKAEAAAETNFTEYKGYRIRSTAYPERGQYQTAGVIEKEFDAEVKEYRFIRAETHPSKEEADAFAIRKGKQIIDEQGDRLFRS